MGFSIRSELASYARLKRRCYFLFVISYGGLLAGLTYAAMTHQSPPLWDRAHPRGRPLRPSAPAAHAKLASLPFPRPARGRLRPHHLCPGGKRTCRSSRPWSWAPWAGLALIYPFYILCSTLEKEGTLKKYAPDQRRKASQETEE